MHISSLRILNYKSYLDSDKTIFKPGFNLVVGKNSAGKTSLTELLTFNFNSHPHKSLKTIPEFGGSSEDPYSKIEVELSIEFEEFIKIIKSKSNSIIYFPKYNNLSIEQTADILNENVVLNKILKLSFIKNDNEFHNANFDFLPYCNLVGNEKTEVYAFGFHKLNNTLIPAGHANKDLQKREWVNLLKAFESKVYCFKAERYKIGKGNFGFQSILRPDASNLPEVLNMLQSNTIKLKRFNEYLNLIFPDIKQISVKPTFDNQLSILVWNIDPSTERDDLAIPLSECGTGIGQVLAILYVILEKEPMVIVIDEPQSFLHPGAARKLIQILKQNFQHQYILATHSSTIVSASSPETITLVRNIDSESKFILLEKNQTEDMKNFLSEVGSKLSDVFGADNILWVEGVTEEKCFPIIIEEAMKASLIGTNIIGMIDTGSFEGRFKRMAVQVYKKLSNGNALMPPALGFIFDREGRSKTEIQDLEREGKDKVKFIKRRMYENYLLNISAITELINSIEDFSDNEITEEDVNKWIEKNRNDKEYWKAATHNKTLEKENWQAEIHGAKLLDNLFKKLSNNTVEYRKVVHSVALTKIIAYKYSRDFDELINVLNPYISTKNHSIKKDSI